MKRTEKHMAQMSFINDLIWNNDLCKMINDSDAFAILYELIGKMEITVDFLHPSQCWETWSILFQ